MVCIFSNRASSTDKCIFRKHDYYPDLLLVSIFMEYNIRNYTDRDMKTRVVSLSDLFEFYYYYYGKILISSFISNQERVRNVKNFVLCFSIE